MAQSTSAGNPPAVYLSIKQAARLLSVSDRTIRRLLRSGELPFGRLGARGPIRISRSAIDALLGESAADPAPPSALDDFINHQTRRRA